MIKLIIVLCKPSFDSVNRERLWEYLGKKGVSEHLVGRMEEIYVETVNRIKVNKKKVVRAFGQIKV